MIDANQTCYDYCSLQGPVMIASAQGGMNIEEVARDNPSAILKDAIDINVGMTTEQAIKMAKEMGFHEKCVDEVSK